MDIGIFLASGARLRTWLIMPPLLIAGIGLGSFAWQQRAEWQLAKTQALSSVLPGFIEARRGAVKVLEDFQAVDVGELASKNQMASFLEDMEIPDGFDVVSVNARNNAKNKGSIPVKVAVVSGKGDFLSTELYINKVKSAQRLFSVASIEMKEAADDSGEWVYEVNITFELLLLDKIAALNGGAP